jgi:uncharacterized protein (DUF302 family)
MADPPGMIIHRSPHDALKTLRRLRAAIERAGLTVFADVDHRENAIEVGLELRPTRLLIFGDPRWGTRLMQRGQTAAIDLPLKILIWEDAEGAVWLAYNDPSWVAGRHGLGQAAEAAVAAISAGLEKLAAAATAQASQPG